MTSKSTFPWVFNDSIDDSFPVRCFKESYTTEYDTDEDRGYGDYGGIYDNTGEPMVGCNEYMVFRDVKVARFIVNAVNALHQIKEELLYDISNADVALKIAQDVLEGS